MKTSKIVGLALHAALLATALVGVSSAMAESTALCAEDAAPCTNIVVSVHEASVGRAKLLTSVGNVECDVLFSGTMNTALQSSGPVTIEGNFTYTNCNNGSGGCTVSEESGPAEIQVLKEGHETAKVTGEGLVHLVCSGFLDCSFNGVGLKGTAKGPLLTKAVVDYVEIGGIKIPFSLTANGEVSLQEQSTTKETGGFLCPKTAKLDILTSPLEATYISS